MKKLITSVLFSFYSIIITAQISFLGFDTTICGQSVNYTYTYSNYSYGNGSGYVAGYKIYKNGVQVYDDWGAMGANRHCSALIFINDSVGFKVWGFGGMSEQVSKTVDYGYTWTSILGSGPPYYLGTYIVNENFVYLVTRYSSGSFNETVVTRCSSVKPSLLIIDDTIINTDVYITDTIIGSTLCNRDSLKIFIQNNTDTITYHINIVSLPAGVNDNYPENVNSLDIYPNPVSSDLTIDFVQNVNIEKAELRIYNLLGKLEFQCIVNKQNSRIDVSEWRNGVYVVELKSENIFYRKKIIKQ